MQILIKRKFNSPIMFFSPKQTRPFFPYTAILCLLITFLCGHAKKYEWCLWII